MVKDPSTLERREKLSSESEDNSFLILIIISFLLLLILPGLDYQYRWSQLLPIFKLLGNIGLIISYMIIFLVMKENPFASKGLTIHEDHKLIKTGLYAVVRHPMYTGLIIMFLCIPLALGSLITLSIGIISSLLLVMRIDREEIMLKQELDGYEDYIKEIHFRLLPKVW